MSGLIHRLLLAGTWFCVLGNPVYDSQRAPIETGLLLNVGPDEESGPEGTEVVTQAGNGAGFKRESGSDGGETARHTGGRSSAASTFTVSALTRVTHLDESLWRVTSPPGSSSDLMSTRLTTWDVDGATASTLSEPLGLDLGTNPMPREVDMESLWTEESRPSGVTEDAAGLMSQDGVTEGTMSSEALPLIFEPVEDEATSFTSTSRHPRLPAAMATGGLHQSDLKQPVTAEADGDSPSQTTPLLTPDWTSPWQASGSELVDPFGQSDATVLRPGTEPDGDLARTADPAGTRPNVSLSSAQDAATTVTMATQVKSRSGLEELESEEDDDDDDEEDEENSEESEEESDEDTSDSHSRAWTQPPYSIIPPPPDWVQQNQGLMRSWVELIREKAGYASGMLAPVGIGIAGALLIVGALYSVRMIHRKRRNSFKHQRRKVRQPEQPGELSTSGQDQAMLLADSSEDEF